MERQKRIQYVYVFLPRMLLPIHLTLNTILARVAFRPQPEGVWSKPIGRGNEGEKLKG
jgi:hypothetical protein